MSRAIEIMQQFNRNALIGTEGDFVVIIEDHADPDGRMYRMEYQTTPDGRHAVAFCRFNPWGSTPSAGVGSSQGHVFSDGALCLGNDHTSYPPDSPYDLNTVIQRARYWCTGFSVLKETGEFPNL